MWIISTSYSTNEITVNWNAPLAWVTAFLDDVANPIIVGTATPNFTATATGSMTFTPTATGAITSTPTVSQSITSTRTATPTRTSTFMVTPSKTPTITKTVTITKTPTKTATKTITKTPTKTATRTITKTPTKTAVPTIVTFVSDATQDGWLMESLENSEVAGTLSISDGGFSVGDAVMRQQYRSILSFNTASLPDTAIITSVLLKVKQGSIMGGGDPFSLLNGLMLDVKNGFLVLQPIYNLLIFKQQPAAHTGQFLYQTLSTPSTPLT